AGQEYLCFEGGIRKVFRYINSGCSGNHGQCFNQGSGLWLTSAGTATPFPLRLRFHSKGAHAASVSCSSHKHFLWIKNKRWIPNQSSRCPKNTGEPSLCC